MTLHTPRIEMRRHADGEEARTLILGEPLRCGCGSTDLVAVAPGHDGDLLDPSVADAGWCAGCWAGSWRAVRCEVAA